MPNDNIRKVYDALASKYTNMAQPYEEFESMMTDEQNRKKVYDALSSKYKNMAQSWDEFNTMLTPAVSQPEPQQSQAVEPQTPTAVNAPQPVRQNQEQQADTAVQTLARGGYMPRSMVPSSKEQWDEMNQQAQEIRAREDEQRQQSQQWAAEHKEEIDAAKEQMKEERRAKWQKFGEALLKSGSAAPGMTATPAAVAGGMSPSQQMAMENSLDTWKEYGEHKLVADALDEAVDYARAAENSKGLGQGFIDMASRPGTWDFGYSDITKGLTLQALAEKWESGEPLSEQEEKTLDMVALATYITENTQNGVGIGYNVGASLPQSLGFMASLALNPASGLGRKLAQRAATKFGKAGLRALGDIAEMGVATVTSGSGRTLADALDRVNGSTQYEISPEGYVTYGGQADREELGRAALKAFGNNFIENYTEAVGEYFTPLAGMLGTLTDKSMRRIGLGKMADFLNKIPQSQWGQMVRKFKDATKFNGVVGEVLEEEIGMFMEPLVIGDTTLGENFNVWSSDPKIRERARDNQLTTILSCALMSGTLYGVEAAGARSRIDRELRNADRRGSNDFAPEEWAEIKGRLDNADPEQLVRELKDIVYNPQLYTHQRQDIVDYAAKLIQTQQFNTASEKAKQEMDEVSKTLTAAYDTGYRMGVMAEPRSFRRVNDALIYAQSQVERLGLGDVATQLQEADAATRSQVLDGLGAEERKAVEFYLGCSERQKGLYEGVQFNADSEYDAAVYNLAPAVVTAEDGTRTITSATAADGRFVYVISQDGAMSIIVDEDDNKEPYPTDQLSDLQVADADAVEQELRKALDDKWMSGMRFYEAHNEKTQEPQIGMVIGDGDETVIVTDMGEGWATVQQAETDKDGNIGPKPNGTTRDVTKEYLLALQDQIYDKRDMMDGAERAGEAEAQAEAQMPDSSVPSDVTSSIRARAEQWAAATGVSARMIERAEDVDNGQVLEALAKGVKVSGWYNTATGDVCFYMPNIMGASEVDKTFIHEVVGHKGMRLLLGEQGYAELCGRVWNELMSEEDKQTYLSRLSSAERSEQEAQLAAADEFIAYFAERMQMNPTEEDRTLWGRFVQMVQDILSRLGLGEQLTTEDLSGLLQASLARYREEVAGQQQAQQPSALESIPSYTDEKTGETDYEWAKAPDVQTAIAAMKEAGYDDDVIRDYAGDMITSLETEAKKLGKPKAGATMAQRQQMKADLKQNEQSRLFWQAVTDAMALNEQAEQEAVRQQQMEAEAEQESIDAYGSDFSDVDDALNQVIDEMDFESMVRYYAAHAKYIWADSDHGTKGFASHMFAAKGNKRSERLANIGWLANRDKGGYYPEEIAERIFADLPESIKQGHDEMEALDIIISTIQSANHPATVVRDMYANLIQKQQEAELREQQRLQEEEERQQDAYARDYGFANYQEMLTFEELWASGEDIVEIPAEQLENYYNTLYGTDTDAGAGTEGQRVVQQPAGQTEGDSGSDTLVQAEGPDSGSVGNGPAGAETGADTVLPGAEQDRAKAAIDVLEGRIMPKKPGTLPNGMRIGQAVTFYAGDAISNRKQKGEVIAYDAADDKYIARMKDAIVGSDLRKKEDANKFKYFTYRLWNANMTAVEGKEPSNVMATIGYYHNAVDIAHGIKEGNQESIDQAAKAMKDYLNEGDILVPMPSHTGKAENTAKLAEAIAKLSTQPNVTVVDGLVGTERQSLYETKKNGGELPKPSDMGFQLTDAGKKAVESGRRIVFVDNVIATGTTAQAALQAVPNGMVLAYAQDKNAKKAEEEKPGTIRFRQANDRASLMGAHNISEEKLRKILKQGGMANPSMAIVDTDKHIHRGYGDISLIPYSSTLDASKRRGVVTYNGDAYSPSYPGVTHQLTDKGVDKIDKMAERLGKGDKNLENYLHARIYDYASENGTRLSTVYLLDKGLDADIIYEQGPRTHGEYERVKDIIERDNNGTTTDEDMKTVLNILTEEENARFAERLNRVGGKEEKLSDWLRRNHEDNLARLTDANGQIYYGKFNSYLDDVRRSERLRNDRRIDINRTEDSSLDRIAKAGLTEDYWKWVDELFTDEERPEMLFAGFTPAGYRRWVPNTLENASRLMNKQPSNNADEWSGWNATKSLLLKRMRTLSDIRKMREQLVSREEYDKEMEELSSAWTSIVGDLSDMQKISDNQFSNMDYAENRLQEAILEPDPITYLNKEYGYDIDKDGEFAKDLQEAIDNAKSASAVYFETKFSRPVYLNEFKHAIVPRNADEELINALKDAGIQVTEYMPGDMDDYENKVRQATEGDTDVRFRVANENQAIFVSNAAKAVGSIKQEKATPDQWLAMLQKQGGIKAGEDKWLGLSEWIKTMKEMGAKTLTKQEIEEFIDANKIQIEEQRYSESPSDYDRAVEDEYPGWNEAFYPDVYDGMAGEQLEWNIKDLAKAVELFNNNNSIALHIDIGEDGEISDSAYDEILDWAKQAFDEIPLEERGINTTRLSYTTNGLVNYREIALWVPDIEPWEEGDNIHFGDAGSGRAVAWIRFGSKRVKREERDYKVVDSFEEPTKNFKGWDVYYPTGEKLGHSYVVYAQLKTGEMGYVPIVNNMEVGAYKSLEEARVAMNERFKELNIGSPLYDNILVIDEIQSKRHQEGREHGYKGQFSQAELDQAREEAHNYSNELYKKYGKPGEDFLTKATKEEKARFEELNSRVSALTRLRSSGIPDAPFDKNWQELAMKRMLRLAAEEGYDKVAWTTGEQQTERYGLAKKITGIAVSPEENGDRLISLDYRHGEGYMDFYQMTVDGEGRIIHGDFAGSNLSDVVGKELATKFLSVKEYQKFEDEDLRVGGEGMKTFYDKMLVNFMNKYGKQWGVKVEDVDIPGISEGGWENAGNSLTMHSIDVTDQMKKDVMEGQTMFRIGDNEKTHEMNDKQKQPGEDYEIEDEVRFRLSKNNRRTIESWLNKRTDLGEGERQSTLSYIDGLDDNKTQLATGWWFAKGTIRLPEDMPKVEQAVAVSTIAKVDPLNYSSPMELINAHADIKVKEKPINPDEVSTLYNKRILANGITVYDVKEGEQSRKNMRAIINTHFGKESSPWCLLQGDENGELTQLSATYWNHYNAYKKQVAFKDGKLLAFSANDNSRRVWWSRQDSPYDGIPVEGKIPDDKLGRSGVVTYSPLTGNYQGVAEEKRWKGNRENGVYEEWDENDILRTHAEYKDGQLNGTYETYDSEGKTKQRSHYKDGLKHGLTETWHTDTGNLSFRGNFVNSYVDGRAERWRRDGSKADVGVFKNGAPIGRHEEWNRSGQLVGLRNYNDKHQLDGPQQEWWPNGQEHYIHLYKNGNRVGVWMEWNSDGNLLLKETYGKNEGDTVREEWYPNGNKKSVERRKNGEFDGVQEFYMESGALSRMVTVKNGKFYGPFEEYYWTRGEKPQLYRKGIHKGLDYIGDLDEYYEDGQLKKHNHFDEDAKLDGIQEEYYDDGTLKTRYSYEHGKAVGAFEHYNAKGQLLIRDYYENGKLARQEIGGSEGPVVFRVVDDPLLIETLEAGKKQKGYRTVTVGEDGTLGSPMAGSLGKKGSDSVKTSRFEIGKWEQAEENPQIATEDGKVNLIKPNGRGSVGGVDYNPYIHIRPTSVNKQFTQAWSRPELAYIETEYPERELTSGYKADKAKLSVGRHPWNGGELILSRWDKPKRIVPWEEVADEWAKEFEDSGVTFDIVSPHMLDILAGKGVKILPPKKAAGKAAMDAYKKWLGERGPEGGDKTRMRIADEALQVLDAYENGDGLGSYLDLVDSIENSDVLMEDKTLSGLVKEYRTLQEIDRLEGRRDYTGGEMDDMVEDEIIPRLRRLADGDTRFREAEQVSLFSDEEMNGGAGGSQRSVTFAGNDNGNERSESDIQRQGGDNGTQDAGRGGAAVAAEPEADFIKPLRKLEEGEHCYVERKLSEAGEFSFIGKDKIESLDDVAYIFRKLETKAIENGFLVFVKDGKPTVLHVGMGGVASSLIDLSPLSYMMKNIQPDKVYLVHNHPSGNIKSSKQDHALWQAIHNVVGSKLEPGIIIDTNRGIYGTFTPSMNMTDKYDEDSAGETAIKTYRFDERVFSPDYKPDADKHWMSSRDVAAFVSSHRLGERDKISVLCMDYNYNILGNFFLPYTSFESNDAINGIAADCAYYCGATGANVVFLYGNGLQPGGNNMDALAIRKIKSFLSNQDISLIDVVACYREEDDSYYSYADHGRMASPAVEYRKPEELREAEADTDTNPTEAQKEAGNYKKGHVRLFGMVLSIENPEGSERHGVDKDGKEWSQRMNNTYGYIRGTMGRDKDHIDFFLGPDLESDNVYIVDQRDVKTGAFDEHKVMLGFDDIDEARDAYNSNYEEGWRGLGAISELTMDEFKEWAFREGRRVQPYNGDVRFRVREEQEYERIEKQLGTAAARYERAMDDMGKRMTEVIQDSMKSVDELQKAIEEESGKPIRDYENAYWAAIQYSSRNKAAQEAYDKLFWRPLMDEVGKLIKGEGDVEAAMDELNAYLLAKHGLERNEVFARRDAKKEYEEYINQHPNGKKTEDEFYLDNRRRDYSGLTALMMEKDVTKAEGLAQALVDSYEQNHDTAELWKRINAATKETLRTSYNGGLLSEDKYKELLTMFQNYVPLRGFDETTSDDVYGYYGTVNSPYNTAIKHAKGRRSLADSPLATIANIADSEIMRSNRNRIYMSALALAEGHRTPLLSVSEVLFERNQQTGLWEISLPQIDPNDTPEEVAQKMAAHRAWFANQVINDPANYRTQKEMQNVPYKVISKAALSEHQILATRAGKQYIITVNGNPRAAQALAGKTNPDSSPALQGMAPFNRFLASVFTQYNPSFVLRNLTRDGIYTNSLVWVKESPEYARTYNKNWGKSLASMASLLKKYNNGTLDDNVPMERYFKEFIENGGETGYTQLRSVKDYKKIMARELKDVTSLTPAAAGRKVMTALGDAVENMNRWAEGVSRFAAYMTSREQGRSVTRSVEDAKEISVNFNKKGSGMAAMTDKDSEEKMLMAVARASQLGRELYVFFNAGIQGMANAGAAVKNNPGKATALMTSLFLAGMALAMMNGGGGDDDDEKEYYNLPEYVRRSNICLKVGKHWLTIPLPIELRALYGLGELAYSTISGNEYYEPKELAYEAASQLSQILPIDFLEGNQGTMAFIPSPLKPAIEAYWLNQDWTGAPIYNKSPYNEDDPEWRKAYRSTNPTLVTAARKLNEWTGGNIGRKGVIDINPARIEHLFEGYLGGVGTILNQAYKLASAITDEDMREVRNIPVVSGFVRDADGRAAQRSENSRYYKINEYVDEVMNEDRRLRQMIAEKTITGYNYDDKDIADAEKRLKELRSSGEWDFVQQWRSLDKARNKARESGAEEEMNALTRQMNDLYREFRKKKPEEE